MRKFIMVDKVTGEETVADAETVERSADMTPESMTKDTKAISNYRVRPTADFGDVAGCAGVISE